ncbi:MAG: alanine dehydrogenase [Candidatus Brocadia sp. AMX2]|uniref:Alanine dehydrogenase n=1 Tax=Candidatus Brocadia sinica JPN1 TaxID=1197129 RepID=A0ABQ0JVC4_9BACT|nr:MULTISPECIES: alanine dehydrogenase [Brocadia]MBC6930976.1 alanine dehydrogenase [Candidatus Brocadia sp.]MBL1167966.1 alanine dehydrogenase [Candidatus Brocadia sp. AMX1]NOG41472.1 alanine dehydrogenase [Planctomycetota bacterium]GIK13809.1 MAG: alanine dehydrogenase [Candidatus Brocadia sinica]KAA0245315.1 MAG: alanine dehydrogenase [Candidatus Brocadia sp. AMX2]
MIVGIPKETKPDEYRVALIPAGVEEMLRHGHTVLIEKGAGLGSGISDQEYKKAGAKLIDEPKEIYDQSQLVMKVKEPLPEEYPFLREDQILFTFFHFAASKELTDAVTKTKIVAIAYETIRDEHGQHPILTPMSEVAGRMSIQEGAKYLEKPMLGRGILLGGVPGVAPAEVVIIGGGIVGTNAAKVAAGLGARVTILDISVNRLRYLDDIMPKNVVTLMSNTQNIREKVTSADLLIGAVLVEGARAPRVVTKEMVQTMKSGAVIIDVAIDQGGCVETSKPTTHSNPIYKEYDVIHYCVTNIPGAVACTSTHALTNVTLPYALEIADKGYGRAARENQAILRGVNMVKGRLTNKAVASAFDMTYSTFE